MSHLLDANALIALVWTRHEHHERVSRWFRAHAAQGWSTCALTQGAFVRVLAHPAFSRRGIGMAEIAELLMRDVAHPKHRMLALDFGMDPGIRQLLAGEPERLRHLTVLA